MKTSILIASMFFATLSCFAQTATDFTCNDCKGTSHSLFRVLDSGKVVVICWVMPCSACVGGALTTQNVVQSYASSNPNSVYMYLCDDYANTVCSSLNSWANAYGLTNTIRFSNASIDMMSYGSTGMPKVVVVGGANHTVFYNADNTISATDLQNAINNALVTTGVNEQTINTSTLTISPNPSGSFADIQFTLVENSDVTLELFNMEGKLVQNSFIGKLNAGDHKININLDSISNGMYLLKLSDGERKRFINLVKEQ